MNTSHDGTAWSLQLNPAGVFASQPARVAFLRAASSAPMVERGSGLWSAAYTGTASMLSAPGSRAYDIVNEDSGFAVALGTPADDPALEREAAGVSSGSAVCVLYDRASEFAAGAFAALRDSAAEAGWNIVDCGSDDVEGALAQRGWDAVIARAPIPQTPEQIAAQWGSGGADVAHRECRCRTRRADRAVRADHRRLRGARDPRPDRGHDRAGRGRSSPCREPAGDRHRSRRDRRRDAGRRPRSADRRRRSMGNRAVSARWVVLPIATGRFRYVGSGVEVWLWG